MNTKIYWFSGTGNSYWLAETLRELLAGSELISISAGAWREMPPPERAVVVYPAFSTRLPLIAQRFLRVAPFKAGADIHLLVNYAMWRAGSLQVARKILADRKLRVRTGFAVKMPNNYTPFGSAPPEGKQQALFRQAAARLKEIAAIIADPAQRAWEGGLFFSRFWILTNPLLTRLGSKEDRHFHADDNCNGCGLCARICPVRNIELRDKRPAWLGHCEDCFRCVQYCPQEAIQYKRITAGRKRYHHPNVPASTWET